MKAIDLTGKKFSRLLVIKQSLRKNNRVMWECLCDCGKTVIVEQGSLTRKKYSTKSCGCYNRDRISAMTSRHNEAHTKLYSVWKNMRRRCYNTHDKSYNRYGGRGIGVCEEWRKDYVPFRDWALENGYDKTAQFGKCTLDRIDPNGDYCPENCRWVSFAVQANNRTNTPFYTYNGETHSLADWARIINIDYQCLYSRVHDNHWDIERALTTPSKGNPWEAHRKKLLNQPH